MKKSLYDLVGVPPEAPREMIGSACKRRMAKLEREGGESAKAEIYAIRDAGTYEQGRELAAAVIAKYRLSYPSAMACLADDLEASLNHLKLPARLRPLVRSSNGLERAFEEERRRSKTIPHFFSEKPCLKLMYGVLARVSGRWARILSSIS